MNYELIADKIFEALSGVALEGELNEFRPEVVELLRQFYTPDDAEIIKSELLAMRVCPECKGTGEWQTFVGLEDCPTCDGKKQVPVTPPASTESKSLGNVYDDAYKAVPLGVGFEHQRAIEAVASAVSLRYKGDLERLEKLAEFHAQRHADAVNRQVEIGDVYEGLVGEENEKTILEKELDRLTTLANENAVLAVEREAENARKDAVIEEAIEALTRIGVDQPHDYRWQAALARSTVSRLAQKGKS